MSMEHKNTSGFVAVVSTPVHDVLESTVDM